MWLQKLNKDDKRIGIFIFIDISYDNSLVSYPIIIFFRLGDNLSKEVTTRRQLNELKSSPIIPLHPSVPNLGFDTFVFIILIFQSYLNLPKAEIDRFFQNDHMRLFAYILVFLNLNFQLFRQGLNQNFV